MTAPAPPPVAYFPNVGLGILSWRAHRTLRRWFLDELIPFAEAHPTLRTVNKFPDLEKELNCRWWRAKHFRVGVAPGLFKHTRADRPPHDEKRFR